MTRFEVENGDSRLVRCHHCGRETPGANLNCIYCGEILKKPVGMMTGLIWGWKGWLGLVLGLLLLLAFLVFLL